jgi:superfamily I DNA and/or RNA helicase
MMSPLSVAQFIDPTQEPFDLMIMDEASQIFPEDSLGAIARAKQVDLATLIRTQK